MLHVSKGLNPYRGLDVHCHGLLHWLPRCRHMWSAATVIFCSNTHFCYWNRHHFLCAPQRYAQVRLPQTIYRDKDRKCKHPLYFHTGAVLWWYQNTVAVSSRPVCQLLTSAERNVSCQTFTQRSFKSLCIKEVGSNERVSFLLSNNRNYRVFVTLSRETKSLLSCYGCILNFKYRYLRLQQLLSSSRGPQRLPFDGSPLTGSYLRRSHWIKLFLSGGTI